MGKPAEKVTRAKGRALEKEFTAGLKVARLHSR